MNYLRKVRPILPSMTFDNDDEMSEEELTPSNYWDLSSNRIKMAISLEFFRIWSSDLISFSRIILSEKIINRYVVVREVGVIQWLMIMFETEQAFWSNKFKLQLSSFTREVFAFIDDDDGDGDR